MLAPLDEKDRGEIMKAVAIAALSVVATKAVEWAFEELKARFGRKPEEKKADQ